MSDATPLIPIDTVAWLVEQVNDAYLLNRSMTTLLRLHSDELDTERQRSAKLQMQLQEAENAVVELRIKLAEYQERNARLKNGLPEFDIEKPRAQLAKTTGQLIDPGKPEVRIV